MPTGRTSVVSVEGCSVKVIYEKRDYHFRYVWVIYPKMTIRSLSITVVKTAHLCSTFSATIISRPSVSMVLPNIVCVYCRRFQGGIFKNASKSLR